jgi:hypothetical protein
VSFRARPPVERNLTRDGIHPFFQVAHSGVQAFLDADDAPAYADYLTG